MTEVRRRKLKDDTSASNANVRSRTLKPPRRLKKTFILLIIAAICVTYFMGLFAGRTQWFDGLAKSLGYVSEYHYAVVIDAGSSGSRVLAYKFRVPFTLFGQVGLDLEEEYFEQSKPGLSAFVDDPAKGAESIVQLIRKAEFMTPAHKRRETPLVVRATAGLRLLPADGARRLLRRVADAVDKLGYDTRAGVEIMDGADEGIFIWYTVNLLHNLLEYEPMAALDLGGGSTQLTYRPAPRDAPPPGRARAAPAAPAAAANVSVYTHSYLNMGLLAARLGVLRLEAAGAAGAAGQAAAGAEGGALAGSCVEPIVAAEPWTYGNVRYSVSGKPRPKGMKREAIFERCYRVICEYIERTMDWEPQHPPRGRVAAMSYFYDVAADAGLIDVMKGGTVTVGAYKTAALRACGANNVEQPWACSDLAYVFALLHRAYKMPEDAPVSLFKKVNGHEVSWALGLAYTTVSNRLAQASA